MILFLTVSIIFRSNHCIMKVSRCLLLMCFALFLVKAKSPTERNISSASDRQQHSIHRHSPLIHFGNESEILWETEEMQITPLKPWSSSLGHEMGDLRTDEIETLTMLFLDIVRVELSQCVLAIVWDLGFHGSVVVDRLSLLPNAKQVILIL